MTEAVAAAPAAFCGVELEWMQARWRDCADRAEQLKIFRDMTGAPKEAILEALGEPPDKDLPRQKHNSAYSREEQDTILRMAAEGRSNAEIARALGRDEKAVGMKIINMRKAGIEVAKRYPGGKRRGPAADPPAGTDRDPESSPDLRREIGELLRAEAELTAALEEVRRKKEEIRAELEEMMGLLDG